MKRFFWFLRARKTSKAAGQKSSPPVEKNAEKAKKPVDNSKFFSKELYRDDNDLGYC